MNGIISDTHYLKDMIISAVRYALGRHTYIVSETIDFLKTNEFLIDRRVKSVIMNDMERYFEGQDEADMDYQSWADFYRWLTEFEPEDEKISIVSV